MSVLLECMAVYYVCARHLEVRRGHWTWEFGVMDSCEPPRGYWELNLGSQQEQVLLTTGG